MGVVGAWRGATHSESDRDGELGEGQTAFGVSTEATVVSCLKSLCCSAGNLSGRMRILNQEICMVLSERLLQSDAAAAERSECSGIGGTSSEPSRSAYRSPVKIQPSDCEQRHLHKETCYSNSHPILPPSWNQSCSQYPQIRGLVQSAWRTLPSPQVEETERPLLDRGAKLVSLACVGGGSLLDGMVGKQAQPTRPRYSRVEHRGESWVWIISTAG